VESKRYGSKKKRNYDRRCDKYVLDGLLSGTPVLDRKTWDEVNNLDVEQQNRFMDERLDTIES
jgi:hypothetical protein